MAASRMDVNERACVRHLFGEGKGREGDLRVEGLQDRGSSRCINQNLGHLVRKGANKHVAKRCLTGQNKARCTTGYQPCPYAEQN
jgi:hypothetical protein